MDKSISTVNQKRSSAPKQPKTKNKQQSLKVVYITNPMKFKASASEFRALVQELTGQDSDTLECAAWFAAHEGGGAEAKVVSDSDVHAVDDEVIEAEHMMNSEAGQTGFDLSGFGSSSLYEDVFYSPEMMEGFGSGLVGCHEAATHVDVYKSLDV